MFNFTKKNTIAKLDESQPLPEKEEEKRRKKQTSNKRVHERKT